MGELLNTFSRKVPGIPAKTMTNLAIGHDSHVGNVRDHNEDCYFVDAENGFCVLADGMGGHDGGDIASKIVVESVSTDIRVGIPLPEALISAHQEVIEAVEDGRGREGMGSTAIAIKINTDKFEIAWVGDSRVYLWDGKDLSQLTKDHSLVQKLVDEGTITEEEAIVHPHRNFVTQAIGMPQLYKMEIGRIQGSVKPGYVFLLCSDGLTNEVSQKEISKVLGLDLNIQQKTELLIQKALENGGSDNVTVVLLAAQNNA